VIEVDFGRPNLLKIEFREFQEFEAHNKALRAKLHIRIRDTEVGMVTAYHLWGHLGHIMVSGHGSGGKMAQSQGKWSGSRNDVAVPKMKGTLLRKNGFYFITNTHARAGPVLVWTCVLPCCQSTQPVHQCRASYY